MAKRQQLVAEEHEVFMARWGTTPREARADYAELEVLRMAAEGRCVLTEVITAPLEEQQRAGKQAMRRAGIDTVSLRLVPGAQLPKTDPNGRELPDGKRGKVLVAKVGTLAPHPKESTPEEQDAFKGSSRAARSLRGQPLYRVREIGPDGVTLSIDDAEVILRAYGKGVRSQRWLDPANKSGDRHLVEEVPAAASKSAP